jgi:hypothetical protein
LKRFFHTHISMNAGWSEWEKSFWTFFHSNEAHTNVHTMNFCVIYLIEGKRGNIFTQTKLDFLQNSFEMWLLPRLSEFRRIMSWE